MGVKDAFSKEEDLWRAALQPTLQPGEELVGVLLATRRVAFVDA